VIVFNNRMRYHGGFVILSADLSTCRRELDGS